MDRFGVSKAQWKPYWLEPVASANIDSIKVSAWTRKGKAFLIVSHLERKPVTAHLQLDWRKIGLKKSAFQARDALTGETLAVNAGSIDLIFAGMSCRFVEISR